MAEMTLEQRKALAIASARLRLQQSAAPAQETPDETDLLIGSPGVRFAMGAASPILGLAQLGAEGLGDPTGTETLKRVEDMKQRGMSPAADLIRLKRGRDLLSRLKGYEAAVAAIDRQIAELEPLAARPAAQATDISGVAGTILSPGVLAAMKIPAAGSVVGRIGQGAGVGAGLGAASPVTVGDDFAASKVAQIGTGAAVGAVIPPAIDVTRKVYERGRQIIDPLLPGGTQRSAGRILAEAAGAKRPEIERELAANRVLVEGSQPTAAEAAAPAGSAEFSALQRMAAEHQPTPYAAIARAQEQARQAALQSFGRTPAEVEAMEAARKAATAPAYKAVREAGDVVDTSQIVAHVNDLLRRNPGNKELVTQLMEIKRGLMNKKMPRTDAEQVSSVLEGMKARMANEDNRFILGELREIRKMIVEAIPGRKEADLLFAQMSKPINEAQVGQELEKALTKPLGVGERPASFAGAMREAPKTIERATDWGRASELGDVLSPENLAKAQGVLADLARKAEQMRLASAGRGRAEEITQAFTLPATGPLHQGYMIFKTILGRVSRGITEKTLHEVSAALRVPSDTLRLLQRVPDQYRQALIDQIIAQKLGRGAIAAGTELSADVVQR